MSIRGFDVGLPDPGGDQAAGLRRLFASGRWPVLALVSNPHVPDSGVAVERLTAALTALDRRVLVLDAGELSPPLPEVAVLGLAPCIETLSPQVQYLAGRGLPRRHVDTRGSAARLLDALAAAAPQADTLLVHASAAEMSRIFEGRLLRPLLLAADHTESVKHAYASAKLLGQRRGWPTFDLLLLASRAGLRAVRIADSLAGCAERFAGLALHEWVAVDPKVSPAKAPGADLLSLVGAQLSEGDAAEWTAPSPHEATGLVGQHVGT
jgi:flagellar biosynthesis protein FlhG